MWRLAQGGSMMVIIMQINLLQVRLLHRPSSAAARSCFIVSRIKRAILAADTGRNWDWLSWQRLVGSNESFTRSRNTILFKKITIYNWAAVILNFNGESNMEASGTLNYDFQKLHTESFNYSLWVLSQSMCHHDIDITIQIYIHIRLQGYELCAGVLAALFYLWTSDEANQEALSQSPASCLPNIQIPWHAEGPFRFPPHQNERQPPIFPISFWLTYILSHRPAWLTRLSGRSVGLARSLHSPLGFPQPSNWIPCVCGRMAATSDKTVGESLSSLSFLEVDLKDGLCCICSGRKTAKAMWEFYVKCIH